MSKKSENYSKGLNSDDFMPAAALDPNLVGEGEPIVFLHGGPGSEHRFFYPI
ncbi:hypothetical protein [Bacillus pseudomycoides]|uniref:hypothetical protein n=1 Tax=Bacillus pseudomycoides TaxID=64104 RepID=UPI0023DC05C4|nr:hypothetical protein [Bacillus pseudomycoides]MDF2082755.1 hypothetical protein [Bacillus pseudomycoides]